MNAPLPGSRDCGGRIAFGRAELDRSITARLARIVAARSDEVALAGDGMQRTYGELDAWTNQIARAILARAEAGSSCIACLVDHGPAMIASAIAVLKTGKAFLCIHPALPPEAQREIIEDAAPGLLIVDDAHSDSEGRLGGGRRPVLRIEDADEQPGASVEVCVGPGDPALIVYTSGSTGRPKGVVKSHRAVLHRAWLCERDDGVGPGDRQSLLTSCAFASSEADLFGALLNGAAVELYDIASRGLADFGSWIDGRRITLLHPPVVLFRRYLDTLTGSGSHPSVRLVALAGETVNPSDIVLWRRHFGPGCELRHRFSSTEAGHIAVACIGPGMPISPDAVPLPSPVEDKSVSLVDANGRAVPEGADGELVVASRFLASGYWRRPDDPGGFESDPEGNDLRRFRTGDLVRLTGDGKLVFLGRQDGQVKIRGYRVELREIERELESLAEIAEAALIAIPGDGEITLAAFLVARNGALLDPSALRSRLRARLPEWKVPTRVERIDSLPLTPTGKVDRQRLLAGLITDEPTKPRPRASDFSDTRARISALWEELLVRQTIDPDAGFFDLGGHSLLAAQLMVRIRQEFGRSLSLASFFEQPTVHGLTEALSRVPASAKPASLVRLKRGTIEPPLICVPPADGSALTYLRLARLLPDDRPVDAVQLDEDRPERIASFEAIAAHCVAAIRLGQPNGPYHLCGYCYGGALAYEVARQLTAAGERVGLLALLEAYTPKVPLRSLPLYRSLPRYVARLVRARLRDTLADIGHRLRHISLRTEQVLATAAALRLAAFHRYEPLRYSGELVLLEAEIPAPHRKIDGPADAWRAFCDRVRSYSIACDHHTMLQDEHLTAVADILAICLNKQAILSDSTSD